MVNKINPYVDSNYWLKSLDTVTLYNPNLYPLCSIFLFTVSVSIKLVRNKKTDKLTGVTSRVDLLQILQYHQPHSVCLLDTLGTIIKAVSKLFNK